MAQPALHGRDHCPGGADPIPCPPNLSVGMLVLEVAPPSHPVIGGGTIAADSAPFVHEITYFRTNDPSTFEWLLWPESAFDNGDTKTLAIKRGGFYRLFASLSTYEGGDAIDGEWYIDIENYSDWNIPGAGSGLDGFAVEHWWSFWSAQGVGPQRSGVKTQADEMDAFGVGRMPSLTSHISFIANDELEPEESNYPRYPVPFSVSIVRTGGTGDVQMLVSLLAIRYSDANFTLEQ